MRHQKAHRKLGRTSEHRKRLLRNLATSLITSKDDRIITTLPKAKELSSYVERAITLSRRARALGGDTAGAQALHLRRQAAGFFHAGNQPHAAASGRGGETDPVARTAGVLALQRLFGELGERYESRPGGYTRIIKLGRRAGDNLELAVIELVDNPGRLRNDSKTEEAHQTRYKKATKRYGELVDKKYLTGLNAYEQKELASLNSTLDELDEPTYRDSIQRLRELVRQKKS
jgi:large subunit ribosomal protein L17